MKSRKFVNLDWSKIFAEIESACTISAAVEDMTTQQHRILVAEAARGTPAAAHLVSHLGEAADTLLALHEWIAGVERKLLSAAVEHANG